ncbi:MAG: DUF721 domain-containing protein [Sandaracinaceae bacterium]
MAKRRRRGGEPQLLGDVIDRGASRALIDTFSWWDRAVPQRIAQAARPVHLRRGTLVVHTKTAAWAQELSYVAAELLRSVKARVPRARIERLRIRVGPMPRPPAPKAERPPPVRPMRAVDLPPDLARALAHVGDGQLRDVLSRAACTSLAAAAQSRRRTSTRRLGR